MGTYTTNYNLFMPTVGETGWGTLVNTNFSTIDTTMKGLSNRITAVENEVNGNLSCTSVVTSGKVTGNGGIVGTNGTFSGAVTGTTCTFSGEIKGATITRTTNYNVTSSTPQNSLNGSIYTLDYTYTCILPPCSNLYNGIVTLKKQHASSLPVIKYITSLDANTANEISFSATASEIKTITLSNANCLYINTSGRVAVGNITLT